jgi:predicted TIM-barrel fold metal-dependent hydrolase
MAAYGMISCDDHLDLQYLPRDLWTSRLPRALQERAPRVEERDGRTVWVCDGATWGGWAGMRRNVGPKPNFNAFDRGGVDESEMHPANARLRLADMDRDGVQAQVMFGPVTSMGMDDAPLRSACIRAYNDWLVEFCTEAPDRLIGVAMLPPEDPAEAAREVYRLADLGHIRQANFQVARANPRLHDAAWEPLWNAFEETGLVMSWHVFVFFNSGPSAPEFGKTAGVFSNTKLFVSQFLDPFVDLFAWGILERHPKLRVVMAESGLGWLPWVVQELDYRHWRLWEAKEYWESRGGIDLHMKPSELFKRQVYVTFQEDYVAMKLLEFYGDGNVLWASDYPHPDSTWPNSRAVVEKQMAGLPEDLRRALVHDNAARLYGLQN